MSGGGSYMTAVGYHALQNNMSSYNTATGAYSLLSNTTGGENTANGANTLKMNTTGSGNSAFGMGALFNNTTGSSNSALGSGALYLNTIGINNTATGAGTLSHNTIGNENTASGSNALNNNATGDGNSAFGYKALFSNTTGYQNTATGANSLLLNTTGSLNTADGFEALRDNTTGVNNTAVGFHALLSNTTGSINTAVGTNSLTTNSTGQNNTATGWASLFSNSTGWENTANGANALNMNTTGNDNSAFGYYALGANTTGANNSAFGTNALRANTTGTYNTANGIYALARNTTGTYNTANGYAALFNNFTGSKNTALGTAADVSSANLTNSTAIGYNAKANASNQVRLGDDKILTLFCMGPYQQLTTEQPNMYIRKDGLFMRSTAKNAWKIDGNANITSIDYIGPQNLIALNFKINGSWAGKIDPNGPTSYGFQACNTIAGAGSAVTGIGYKALFSNTGNYNTAVGYQSLYTNSAGSQNTATGHKALFSNWNGYNNTAIGVNTLYYNQSGTNNTAVGHMAGFFGNYYDQCTFIGAGSSLTATRANVTLLGYGITNAECTGNNQVLLGNTAITAIRAAVADITAYSDARFKTNIKANVAGLDFILKLKPVTYNVRPKELHKIWGTPDSVVNKMDFSEAENQGRIGFLAQDVEKAAEESGFDFPGIDVPRNDKEVYSLRYVDFIMPMVKSIQELDKKETQLAEAMQENARQNAELLKLIGSMQAKIEMLESQVNGCCELKSTMGLINPGTQGNNQKVELTGMNNPYLGQNVPNPFREETRIEYYVPQEMLCDNGSCSIIFYDQLGRIIKETQIQAGFGTITLNTQNLSTGVYIYKLVIQDKVIDTKKMLFSK
jgi:hypothetical protein